MRTKQTTNSIPFSQAHQAPSPSSSTSSPPPHAQEDGEGDCGQSITAPLLLLPYTFPAWWPSHRLQSFTNCASVGLQDAVLQGLLKWVSHEQKFLTENLLLHGHLYIDPASASAWAAASLGSPPAPAWAHPQGTTRRSALLWYPVGLRGTACST